MKKKLLSLALALAACLSLTVPALADVEVSHNGDSSLTGQGWNYDTSQEVLKLSGVQNLSLDFWGSCIIELAPGTKSSIAAPLYVENWGNDGIPPVITFRGTGELEIIDTGKDNDYYTTYVTENHGVFSGFFSEVKFEDGLEMTGGAKQGDRNPLTLSAKHETDDSGWFCRDYQANGTPVRYVHIGPADNAGTATPDTTATTAPQFTDVAATSPFAQAISWAVEQGITKGITPTTFGPGNTCTVSHILTFLWRSAGQPGDSVTDWAAQQGIDAKDMSAPCTRSMAVEFMWKAAGQPKASKTASFTDVSASAAYAPAVNWAVEKGITSGTSASAFSPDNNCTRGQIVTFLYRASK